MVAICRNTVSKHVCFSTFSAKGLKTIRFIKKNRPPSRKYRASVAHRRGAQKRQKPLHIACISCRARLTSAHFKRRAHQTAGKVARKPNRRAAVAQPSRTVAEH